MYFTKSTNHTFYIFSLASPFDLVWIVPSVLRCKPDFGTAPGTMSRSSPRRQSRTIREFDSSFVVKQFGFRSVEDYYSAASLADKLDRIKVPLLGLNAADDPFIPFPGQLCNRCSAVTALLFAGES